MGLIDVASSTNTAKSAGIVTIWITAKSRRIHTYERGFNSMKTFNFNPCISHTYDDRACNPCISNTYEKHRGVGDLTMGNLRKCLKGWGSLWERRGQHECCPYEGRTLIGGLLQNSAIGSAASGRSSMFCSAGLPAGAFSIQLRRPGGQR